MVLSSLAWQRQTGRSGLGCGYASTMLSSPGLCCCYVCFARLIFIPLARNWWKLYARPVIFWEVVLIPLRWWTCDASWDVGFWG
jgi:hypothetical protein